MEARHLAVRAVLVATAVALSGCYTVLQSPLASSGSRGADQYAPQEQIDSQERLSPRVGRFPNRRGFEDRDGFGDSWGYDPYGSGAGFPIFSYDSRYGAMNYGSPYAPGYGYGAYSSGYGPYGYGYDPYYQGADGTYIPPGYELVTTQELQRLQQDSQLLEAMEKPAGPDPAELEEQRRQEVQQAEETWARRTEYQERKSPQPTVRPAPRPATSSEGQAKPAAAQPSGESSAKRRKTRR